MKSQSLAANQGLVQQTIKFSRAVPSEEQQSRSGIFPVILPEDTDHKITLSFQRWCEHRREGTNNMLREKFLHMRTRSEGRLLLIIDIIIIITKSLVGKFLRYV